MTTDGGGPATEDWRPTLAEAGELAAPIVKEILDQHGDRGQRAIEAVTERRVKQYNDFTVVVGHSDEYVVEDESCQCEDAQYNLDPDDPTQRCWHAIAVAIATRIDAVDTHDMWYSDVRDDLLL